MKKILITMLFCVLAMPTAFARDHYIADNLSTFMHSGPNNTYRIIGSVNAGTKIKLISMNKASGYSKISDDRNRTGWVETKLVTRKESRAIRLPRIEKELSQVKHQLMEARQKSNDDKAELANSLDSRNSEITDLKKKYSDINVQLSSVQTENRQLRAKLDTQKDDMLLKYFTYGGGVAGIGLLLGLILPHIMPRRKKSPNGWA